MDADLQLCQWIKDCSYALETASLRPDIIRMAEESLLVSERKLGKGYQQPSLDRNSVTFRLWRQWILLAVKIVTLKQSLSLPLMMACVRACQTFGIALERVISSSLPVNWNVTADKELSYFIDAAIAFPNRNEIVEMFIQLVQVWPHSVPFLLDASSSRDLIHLIHSYWSLECRRILELVSILFEILLQGKQAQHLERLFRERSLLDAFVLEAKPLPDAIESLPLPVAILERFYLPFLETASSEIQMMKAILPNVSNAFCRAVLDTTNQDLDTAVSRILDGSWRSYLPPDMEMNVELEDDALSRLREKHLKLRKRSAWDDMQVFQSLADEDATNIARERTLQLGIEAMYEEEEDDVDFMHASVDPMEDDVKEHAATPRSDPTASHMDVLLTAVVSDSSLFDRKNRSLPARKSLKERTRLSDEQIEGWYVMFMRHPRRDAIIRGFDFNRTAEQIQQQRHEEKEEENEENSHFGPDRGRGGRILTERGRGGRGRGGRGRGWRKDAAQKKRDRGFRMD